MEKVLKRIFLALVILSVCALAGTNLGNALAQDTGKTIIVDDDGDGDYAKIWQGIVAAKSGDTIIVRGGVYYESINIYKSSIILKGEKDPNGPAIPVIGSTGASSPIISISADSCVVQGFKIMGDKARTAIYVKGSNNIIKENTILNSYAGIVVWGSGNVISSNSIGLNTVGVQIYNSFNTVENNDFWGDKECIYTSRASSLEISGNTFAGYQTGISINFDYPTESYCQITNNNFLEPDALLGFLGLGVKSATFHNCLRAQWRGNYWGVPHIVKIIWGTVEHGNTEYPWINIDWRPAKIPRIRLPTLLK